MKTKDCLVFSVMLLIVLSGMSACGSDAEGTGGTPSVQKTVSGTIEKGPFVQGSRVTLYELKNDLTQTGRSFRTQTNSDLGAFRFESVSLESQFVELETSGYFYNEVKGGLSSSEITLNALSDISNRNAVNVNIITHLEFGRVKKLVQSGSSFSNAKKQAERELLKCFAITDEISNPEGISVTDNSVGSSILLAISTIMLYDKSEGEFTEFLAKFMADFADNGIIDNQSIRDGIAAGQKNAHPSEVTARMKEFYANKGVQIDCRDFSTYIDFNGDGVIDDQDKEENTWNYPAEENLFTSESYVRNVLSGMYASLSEFIGYQTQLERARLTKSIDVNPSDPNDRTLYLAWEAAYKTIHIANRMVNGLKYNNNNMNPVFSSFYAEALVLRSFVYYQLAMLWGNVPLVTEAEGLMDKIAQRSQPEVLEFVQSDVVESKAVFGTNTSRWDRGELQFNEVNVNVLLAEVLLTLKQRSEALQLLQAFSNSNLMINGMSIYDSIYLELLSDEAKGNTTGLGNRWKDFSLNHYGAWAALKRLGEAQTISSCKAYELLLPIPAQEIRNSMSSLKQNPGY